MKSIFKLTSVLICIIIIGLSIDAQAQKHPKLDSLLANKITFGIGMGLDHAGLGLKIKYNFNENLGLYTAIGVAQVFPVLPVLGVEYKDSELLKDLWTPYINMHIGRDVKKTIHFNNTVFPDLPTQIIREKVFNTLTMGGGIYYGDKIIELNLGLACRVLSNKNVNTFYREFNNEYQTNFSTKNYQFLPMIAAHLNLYYFRQDLKRRRQENSGI